MLILLLFLARHLFSNLLLFCRFGFQIFIHGSSAPTKAFVIAPAASVTASQVN